MRWLASINLWESFRDALVGNYNFVGEPSPTVARNVCFEIKQQQRTQMAAAPAPSHRQQLEQFAVPHLRDTYSPDQIAILSDHDLQSKLKQMSITIPQSILDGMTHTNAERHVAAFRRISGPSAMPSAVPAASTTALVPFSSTVPAAHSPSAPVGGGVQQPPFVGNVNERCGMLHQRFTTELKRYSQQIDVLEDMKKMPLPADYVHNYYECVQRTHKYLSDLCNELKQLVHQLAHHHEQLTQFEDDRILKPKLGDDTLYKQLRVYREQRAQQLVAIQKALAQPQT